MVLFQAFADLCRSGFTEAKPDYAVQTQKQSELYIYSIVCIVKQCSPLNSDTLDLSARYIQTSMHFKSKRKTYRETCGLV